MAELYVVENIHVSLWLALLTHEWNEVIYQSSKVFIGMDQILIIEMVILRFSYLSIHSETKFCI